MVRYAWIRRPWNRALAIEGRGNTKSTDGTQWNCYDLVEDRLRLVSELALEDSASDVDRLVVWLEGVLATTHDIAPTAENIEQRLGTGSSAYELDRATRVADALPLIVSLGMVRLNFGLKTPRGRFL